MTSEAATVGQDGGFYLPVTGSDIGPAATHLLNGTNDLVIIPNSERLINLSSFDLSHEIKLLSGAGSAALYNAGCHKQNFGELSCTSD